MDDPTSDSPLDRAVSLAAWLIRTGKQPPAKAHRIAARRHHVDLHAVAQLVGQRGGRAASADRRRGQQGNREPTEGISAPPSSSPNLRPVVLEVLDLLPVGPTSVKLSARPLDGPHASCQLNFELPVTWMPDLHVGARVTFEGDYRPGPDGPTTLFLGRCLGFAPVMPWEAR